MPSRGEYEPGTVDWARRQAERFEASDGARSGTIAGRPIIVLTSVGAKTGSLRKTALMRVEHEGRYLVVASNGGARSDPAWVANLRANPQVELHDRAVRGDYIAREPADDERETWWQRAVEAFPTYAMYQARTKRRIPVFVLEPRD